MANTFGLFDYLTREIKEIEKLNLNKEKITNTFYREKSSIEVGTLVKNVKLNILQKSKEYGFIIVVDYFVAAMSRYYFSNIKTIASSTEMCWTFHCKINHLLCEWFIKARRL